MQRQRVEKGVAMATALAAVMVPEVGLVMETELQEAGSSSPARARSKFRKKTGRHDKHRDGHKRGADDGRS